MNYYERKNQILAVVLTGLAAVVMAVGAFAGLNLTEMTNNQAIFFAGLVSIGLVFAVGANLPRELLKLSTLLTVCLTAFFALVYAAEVVNCEPRSLFAAGLLFAIIGGLFCGGIAFAADNCRLHGWGWKTRYFFLVFLAEAVGIALPIILIVKLSN